ncbi:P-loop containing nucleoside triphosphate hydrolase protein [Fusarium redolens]|uniref:P-loop containing nucleoside triphosphate hydrolase protein n=1 Tax=Fusarium redolens TaxID=48865 RepID=A0A9P9FZ02_FUSRE|nr:P-loop containing nucleoside triphosphate hydrolase protein [Fusarium redolens]KAH7230074.1 P-loop containing nucleoside triphosphate hydrolase protein [Fusarium redolens]
MSPVADMPHPFVNSRSTRPPSPSASTISDSNTLEVENAEMAFAARFITAVETLVDNKLSNSHPDGTEKPETKGGQPHIGRGTILSYKHVEEAWDDKTFKYKIVEDNQSRIGNLDQFVFVARDRIGKLISIDNRRTQDKTTFIDVKSAALRDILREACRDFRGISLAGDTPSIEQNVVFHIRSFLRYRRDTIVAEQDAMSHSHLNLFVDYIEAEFHSVDEELAGLAIKNEITFDLLWALFEPNEKVFTTCPGTGSPRCVLHNYCEEGEEMDGSKFVRLDTRFLGTDGKIFGEATNRIKIPHFPGARRIDFLPAYPLRYHHNYDEIFRELVENGRRFISLHGSHHLQYRGFAFFFDDEGEIVKRHVDGRIMVDPVGFREHYPGHPQPTVRNVNPIQETPGPSNWTGSFSSETVVLQDEDFLICGPTVLGFCLGSKKFLEFAVAYISDITWMPSSYDDVKIPDAQKKAIWALTHTYFSGDTENGLEDIVQGKGRGINFLLYGPPGVGKTLTAETIAETHRRPLYVVPAGQIGVDPVQVENILTNTFKIAGRWKAILLLDEADVFVSQRSDNPQVNALVSVFLRELERFDGIMFLTTNRVQSFDTAMMSRIHLALEYKPLGIDSRRAVWKFFLEKARTQHGTSNLTELVDIVAHKELNGREIRNTVLVAQSMAVYEGTVVCEDHLMESITAREQVREHHLGVGASDNLRSYF